MNWVRRKEREEAKLERKAGILIGSQDGRDKDIIVFKVLSMAALVCLAPITKYHRLSGLRTAENYCSWFWRIDVSDQGAILVW